MASTAPPHSTLGGNEVSPHSLKKPRPYSRGSTHVPQSVREVVRLQRKILHADGEEGEDLEEWTTTQVVRECTHPTSRERTLTLRYEDGVEEDVCEGAVHRPAKVYRLHRRRSHPSGGSASNRGLGNQTTRYMSEQQPTLIRPEVKVTSEHEAYVRRGISPPPPREGHASSPDELSANDSEVGETNGSEATESDVPAAQPMSPS